MAKWNGDTSLSEVQEMMLQPLDVNNGDVDGEGAFDDEGGVLGAREH